MITALYFYSLLLSLFLPLLIPNLHIFFFAPFLISAFYRKNQLTCLWLALLSGLTVDLLSSQTRFGIHAVNYCLTILVLFPQRHQFFEDSLSKFPILTFLFGVVSTLFQMILLYSLNQSILLSWKWVASDLLIMPLLDAAYAFLFFTLPSLFLPKARTRQTTIFSLKGLR